MIVKWYAINLQWFLGLPLSILRRVIFDWQKILIETGHIKKVNNANWWFRNYLHPFPLLTTKSQFTINDIV